MPRIIKRHPEHVYCHRIRKNPKAKKLLAANRDSRHVLDEVGDRRMVGLALALVHDRAYNLGWGDQAESGETCSVSYLCRSSEIA